MIHAEHFHVFESSLYDDRFPGFHSELIREDYEAHHRMISTVAQLKFTLRAGPYAWLAGPVYLVTDDGAALCFKCAHEEFRNIVWSIQNECSDGWRVIGCDVNYEDPELYCDHCSKLIESACGEDEE